METRRWAVEPLLRKVRENNQKRLSLVKDVITVHIDWFGVISEKVDVCAAAVDGLCQFVTKIKWLSNVQLYNLHHILKKNTFSQKTFQLKSPLPFRLLTILLAGPSLGVWAFGQALVSCLRRWLRALYTSIKRSFTYWISRSTDSALSRSSRFLPSRPWSWSSNVSNSARFLWRYLLKTINTEDIQFYLQKVWSFKSHTQLLCNARKHCSLKHNTILPLSSAFMTKCNFRTPTKFSMLTRLE